MQKNHFNGKNLLKITYCGVLLSFIIPIIYLIIRIFSTDNIPAFSDESYRSVADYVLMLVQCVLGVFVIHIPSFLSKTFKFDFPPILYMLYIIFLYCAIFLGEVRNFYYTVPNWDVVLHCFSSIMAGTFGFLVVSLLNHSEKTSMNLSPILVSMFSFCFAVSLGAIWEIYEFTFDGILGLNMQKFMLADGTVLSGHDALRDTMKDIIVDCIGASFASVIGFISMKKGKYWFEDIRSKKNPSSKNQATAEE